MTTHAYANVMALFHGALALTFFVMAMMGNDPLGIQDRDPLEPLNCADVKCVDQTR